MNMHLFLTGYRGTGKTTVGCRVAELLEREVIDLDKQIESRSGKNIRAIFSEVGESGFRDLETTCLLDVVTRAPAVISLGGGAVLKNENREVLHTSGKCVWLQATAETIHRRLSGDQSTPEQRPALTTLPPLDEIRHLLELRDQYYREVADFCVDTDSIPSTLIADQICQWWNSLS